MWGPFFHNYSTETVADSPPRSQRCLLKMGRLRMTLPIRHRCAERQSPYITKVDGSHVRSVVICQVETPFEFLKPGLQSLG